MLAALAEGGRRLERGLARRRQRLAEFLLITLRRR
jgi:hypothetical protein